MKRYFEERFLPQVCYPTEAALWRAFGRLPWPVSFNGEDESRDDFNGGNPVTELGYGYSEKELVASGIDVDHERYEEAGYITLPARPLEGAYADRYLEDLAEVEWKSAIDRKMDAILEAHKAVVFEALASGRVSATGYRIPREIEHGTAEWPDARREDIPRDAWTMRGFDWDTCKLELHDGSVFRCVVVNMEKVLSLWPEPPSIPAQEKLVSLYGDTTIVLNDDQGPTAGQQHNVVRRGAPPKGDNLSLRQIVVNLFGGRAAKVAAGEKEALVAEVMDFAHRASGHAVGRSTVQGWLKPLYFRAPETMPENHANNSAA